MGSTKVPFVKSLSRVSFDDEETRFSDVDDEDYDDDGDNDNEHDDDMDMKTSSDEQQPSHNNRGRRKRTSSVFSIEDYLVYRKERSDSKDLRGQYLITHSDTPKKNTEREIALGYFEQKESGDQHHTADTFPGGTTTRRYSRFQATSEQRRQSRFSYANINNFFVGDRRESRITDTGVNRKDSLAMIQRKFRLGSDASEVKEPPPAPRQNKHPLEPVDVFDITKVNTIIREELVKIKNLPSVNQNIICADIANDIKRRVKMLKYNRYKYIVMVTMGEKKNQGMNISSCFSWDEKHDTYASQTLEIDDCFVVAVVYALYHF